MNIAQKIFAFTETKGINDRQLSQLTGISTGLISSWRTGKKQPGTRSIKKVADAFKLPASYFLEEGNAQEDYAKAVDVTFDDFTYAMYDESRDLTDEQKKMLLDMARMLRERQHREGKDKQ